MKLYQALSSALGARQRCSAAANNPAAPPPGPEHWRGMSLMHSERIEQLTRDHLPAGSGFDSGCKFNFDESRPDRLVISCDFHHMDENGFYCGWSNHSVVITPSLAFGFVLRITGRDTRQIKDYISDTFNHALNAEVK